MNDQTESGVKKNAIAAGELLGALTRLAGMAAALYGLAYYVGWREEVSYYTSLGCPWLTSLLPASVFLQTGMPAVIGIAASGLICIQMLLNGDTTIQWLRGAGFWTGMVALGVALLLLLFQSRLPVGVAYLLVALDGVAFAIVTGLLLAELVGHFAESRMEWRAHHLGLIYLVVMYGIWQGPDDFGRVHATFDINPASSRLAVVSVVNEKQGEDWRLVTALGEKLVVVRLAPREDERTFRLVTAEEISGIRQPK